MDAFSDLSTPGKITVLGIPVGVAGADAFFIANGTPWTLVLLVSLVALILAAGLLFFLYRWNQKRKGRALEADIDDVARRSSGASRPEERAQMEDMRRRFVEGFDLYKREGFNTYDVPWYLVMGEPGSGKTFAVRNSGIGFLPGMQNERQGTGGTKTMDWWFTKAGVLLDTAGRWSVGAGGEHSLSSQELAQFLALLRKNRKRCPINGLILVLDGEKMQNETKDESTRKAKLLSEALFQVKRELDVRFPVIVWISKCDTIPGFRSYFDSFTEAKQQNQMLGWSNPAANIDEPFRPELVEEFLSGVVTDLRSRRWQLLYDQKLAGDARRIDAVDSLFVFPAHLEKLAPAVRTYMEIIFSDMRRAPFLRGIYFNSAITEGAEVDHAIAEAMGLTPQQYREQSRSNELFRKDRALFIRDTLAEKLFRERNLVTRASNAVAALRRTQIMGVAALVLCLGAMATVAWFSSRKQKREIGDSARGWQIIATQLKSKPMFPTTPDAAPVAISDVWHNIEVDAPSGGKMSPFAALASTLADCANERPIPPPFGWFVSRKGVSAADRRKAWSRIFDQHYLQPLAKGVATVGDSPTNREVRISTRVRLDALLSTNPIPALDGKDPFAGQLLGSFLDASPADVEDHARLLIQATQAGLAQAGWYKDAQTQLLDRTADAFDELMKDKQAVLGAGRERIASARKQAAIEKEFVEAQDQFESELGKVNVGRLAADDLTRLRRAFDQWVERRPAARPHQDLAGAGKEALKNLEDSFAENFRRLQSELQEVKGSRLAPDFLAKLNAFRTREVEGLNEQWGQLAKEYPLEAIARDSQASEQLLKAVAGVLTLFGKEFSPKPSHPFEGWSNFLLRRDEVLRGAGTLSGDLKRILEVAQSYQLGRAQEEAGIEARRVEQSLARWPIVDSPSRIPEGEMGPLLADARKGLQDPLGLGHAEARPATTNLVRLIGVGDQLLNRKRLALQFRLQLKPSDPYRSLQLKRDGEWETDFINREGEGSQQITRLLPIEGFEYRVRMGDQRRLEGAVVGRWQMLQYFWDPAKGTLRTNHVVELPLSENRTIGVQVLGATWTE